MQLTGYAFIAAALAAAGSAVPFVRNIYSRLSAYIFVVAKIPDGSRDVLAVLFKDWKAPKLGFKNIIWSNVDHISHAARPRLVMVPFYGNEGTRFCWYRGRPCVVTRTGEYDPVVQIRYLIGFFDLQSLYRDIERMRTSWDDPKFHCVRITGSRLSWSSKGDGGEGGTPTETTISTSEAGSSNYVNEVPIPLTDAGRQEREAYRERLKQKKVHKRIWESPGFVRFTRSADAWFQASSFYEKAEIPWTSGLLLDGPPGNGKTTAVIEWARRNAMSVYVPDLATFTDDEFLKRVRDISNPRGVVVLIEDVDEYGPFQEASERKRTEDDGFMRPPVCLQTFLQLLSGTESVNGILFVTTANNPDRLPDKLVRAGRIDERINFGNPDAEGRVAIAERFIDDGTLFTDAKLSGRSVAEIESVAKRVCLNRHLSRPDGDGLLFTLPGISDDEPSSRLPASGRNGRSQHAAVS